ncbi:hypothetical protein Lal_00036814, partial [Lupinus albus]
MSQNDLCLRSSNIGIRSFNEAEWKKVEGSHIYSSIQPTVTAFINPNQIINYKPWSSHFTLQRLTNLSEFAFSSKESKRLSKLFLNESTPSSSSLSPTKLQSMPNFSRALYIPSASDAFESIVLDTVPYLPAQINGLWGANFLEQLVDKSVHSTDKERCDT